MKFANFRRILDSECQIDPTKPIVLGFSGGPDSLALLHTLHEEGLTVIVAHLDHGLRLESAQEAVHAEKVAWDYGYPFVTERADVADFAAKHTMSIEEAARERRYEFLFRTAAESGAQAVAVAHNADDQVETVLMHLLRGAGPRGLRGMSMRSLPNPWNETIPLVRPLLGVWHQEIMAYCAANDLRPVIDQTNLDTMYFRNRLRHELLPNLEQFSPGVKQRLYQTADLLAAEGEALDGLAEEAWRRCLSKLAGNYIQLSRIAVLDEPLALQRLVVRHAAETLRPGLRDLDFALVQKALDLIQHPLLAPQDWLAGLCILVEGDRLWLADWDADLPVDWPQAPAAEIHVEVPGDISLDQNWRLELREVSEFGDASSNTDPFQAWLDSRRLGDELVLRRRQPGDRFQPLGMEQGSLKLSDFMINEKMPRRARETWPLLCKGDEIVWVPGYQLAHPYCVQAESRQTIHARLLRPEENRQ
jgi:tRNA(Ile)-lysidine synthase